MWSFGNIQNIKQLEQDNLKISQDTDFNKQFDAYNRNIYGSELLSLANRIENYNKKYPDEDGYQAVSVVVEISKEIDSEYFKKGTYIVENSRNDLQKVIDNINKNIEIIR